MPCVRFSPPYNQNYLMFSLPGMCAVPVSLAVRELSTDALSTVVESVVTGSLDPPHEAKIVATKIAMIVFFIFVFLIIEFTKPIVIVLVLL